MMAARLFREGIMPRSVRSLRLLILLATLFTPLAYAAQSTDRLFASGFAPALVIEGTTGYPGPLVNAQIEAHFGDTIATATAAADGTYRIGLEIDQIDPTSIVELFARGTAAQMGLVWASPLGPASRLLTLAGDSRRIDFAKEPFVHLSPRSTVAAAAARVSNGGRPIADAATFWRAIRSREYATDDLVYALALVARGMIPLPNGMSDTFEAVSSVPSSWILSRAYWSLQQNEYCAEASQSAFCEVYRNLPLDARMFPPIAWTPGELYSSLTAFRTPTLDRFAFRPDSSGGASVLTRTGTVVPSTAASLPDGGYELTPIDINVVYASENDQEYVNGVWVPVLREAMRLYLRLVRGAAGQVEIAWSLCYRSTYPENPEIPTRYTPCDREVLPSLSGSNPLPPELLDYVPEIAGHRWALPSPLKRPMDASVDSSLHGYDVHMFDASTAVAERSRQSFAYGTVAPGVFSLDGGGQYAEFRFVNEEQPGVWRVRMHVSGNATESVVDGLLLPVDAGALTTANVPGVWRSRGYGDLCLGPYADMSCDDDRSFDFQADGTAAWLLHDQPIYAGHWSLAAGSDTGRLSFAWQHADDPSRIYSRVGWELIHEDDDHRWVLETRTHESDDTGQTPPIVFNPTMWLIRYDRQ